MISEEKRREDMFGDAKNSSPAVKRALEWPEWPEWHIYNTNTVIHAEKAPF